MSTTKLVRIIFVIVLFQTGFGLPTAWAAKKYPFFDQRTLIDCAKELARLKEPTASDLDDYSGSEDPKKIGKLRYDLWVSFLKRPHAEDTVPFSLALDNGLRKYKDDLGSKFHVLPFSVAFFDKNSKMQRLPAVFSKEALFLNAFSYREDPNLLFARALWKEWVFSQFLIDNEKRLGALHIFENELARISGESWPAWGEKLSDIDPEEFQWHDKKGNNAFETRAAERNLIVITAEALSRMATFRWYEKNYNFHPQIKSESWDRGLNAQQSGELKSWFIGSLAKQFKLETYQMEYILLALTQTGLPEAWEFPPFPDNLGYEIHEPNSIRISGEGSCLLMQFVEVGNHRWLKRSDESAPFVDARWDRRCDHTVTHTNLNPLVNPHLRLRWTERNDGKKLGQVMANRVTFMENGQFYPWAWGTFYFLTDMTSDATSGLVKASASWNDFVNFPESTVWIDPVLIN
jgi:hypothetical protein